MMKRLTAPLITPHIIFYINKTNNYSIYFWINIFNKLSNYTLYHKLKPNYK